jgi:hypothetical protein
MNEDTQQQSGTPIIEGGYISRHTGQEIDTAVDKAYQAEFTYITAEEVENPVSIVSGE